MWSRNTGAAILTLTALAVAPAADIDGRVIIKRKLSNRTVTVSACFYQRGATVQLGSDADKDPLEFERSHVIVYLEGPATPTTRNAVMEQKDRRFVPDLLVVPAGSTVSLPNEDAIFHNVFSLSKPKSFDLGNYAKGQTRSLKFTNPGIVFVNCHLHPNMGAVIFVSPNQWSTRADEEGHFQLSDVPPGDYTIVAWHKAAGFFRQTAHVSEQSLGGIEFLIPFDEVASEKKDRR
jgi:plastocyanin